MPVHQGGNPIVWGDGLGSSFGAQPGASAPSLEVLSVADPADATMDIKVLGFNESTEDRQHAGIQIQHNLHLPASGNVTFKPHIHWTFLSEPTTSETVIWKLSYVYAKGATVLANAGVFASAPSILTASTYTTVAGAEVRAHLISAFGDIAIAVANCGPSMMFLYTVKLDGTSTIAATKVAGLYVDFHYQMGPVGTVGEYS